MRPLSFSLSPLTPRSLSLSLYCSPTPPPSSLPPSFSLSYSHSHSHPRSHSHSSPFSLLLSLLPKYVQSSISSHRRIGICAFDEVLENLEELAHSFVPQLLPPLLQYSRDEDAQVRQVSLFLSRAISFSLLPSPFLSLPLNFCTSIPRTR